MGEGIVVQKKDLINKKVSLILKTIFLKSQSVKSKKLVFSLYFNLKYNCIKSKSLNEKS